MWFELPYPTTWEVSQRQAFANLAQAFEVGDSGEINRWRATCRRDGHAGPAAAASVLEDLASQGWSVKVDSDGAIAVAAAVGAPDAVEEKRRVQFQELLKRDEQLRAPSVRRFIASMEKPREYQGKFVSVFSLMRDGEELAHRLAVLSKAALTEPSTLRSVIDPYPQVVTSGRCQHTGLKLVDIWRYFRHTWSNQYTSTPGRTMMVLIRDRAAPFHPIIGIAALGSAVVQLAERDEWIGWQRESFLKELEGEPTLQAARWISRRLDVALSEIYVDDLVKDGFYWPSLWKEPDPDAIERLIAESKSRRQDHHRFVKATEFKQVRDPDDVRLWRERAESNLFRSKRCLALAELLSARRALSRYIQPKPSREGLRRALGDPQARRAIVSILRRAKAEAAGTEIADLTVCGAIAPYNAVLGGKLVSMLAVSPSMVQAYKERYSHYASEIASSIAGKPIRRRSNLVFIGTTSLYGSGASQYNRVRIPTDILGRPGGIIEYRQLGRSKAFGTSHLSARSVEALVRLAEQSAGGARVNSIFGEGVNPKLRKVRHGLDLLGWPSDALLQHGRQRIIYGINLVDNLLPYLLGIDQEPRYKFRPRSADGGVTAISDWWMRRWLARRIQSPQVLMATARHSSVRPVEHGARVLLPPPLSDPDGPEQLELLLPR